MFDLFRILKGLLASNFNWRQDSEWFVRLSGSIWFLLAVVAAGAALEIYSFNLRRMIDVDGHDGLVSVHAAAHGPSSSAVIALPSWEIFPDVGGDQSYVMCAVVWLLFARLWRVRASSGIFPEWYMYGLLCWANWRLE